MSKLVYGVGINDADYSVVLWEVTQDFGKQKRKLIWCCPFYRAWSGILRRGYGEEYKAKKPTYKNVLVCVEWYLFSTFKAWMETQDWEGKDLDKDLLVHGNKVYGPDTCVFVSRVVNGFMLESGSTRGKYMIGVSWNKKASKFHSQINNPITRKKEHLGYFTSELEAHKAWLKRKLEHAYALAAIQTDTRVAKALVDRYSNYTVEHN